MNNLEWKETSWHARLLVRIEVFLLINDQSPDTEVKFFLKSKVIDGKENEGQTQWLIPVIPTFWEAEVGRLLLEPRSSRPAWAA